jgi:hypothetical protein
MEYESTSRGPCSGCSEYNDFVFSTKQLIDQGELPKTTLFIVRAQMMEQNQATTLLDQALSGDSVVLFNNTNSI